MGATVLVSLLALALAAAGCGSGGGDSTSTAAKHTAPPNGEKSIEEFGSEAAGPSARFLSALLAPTAATISHEQAEGRITKVRVQGKRAFVVFHAPGAKLYMLTMVREGGGWKAATVAASILVPSAATLGQ
jgi:hypothetical protein